MIICSQCHDRGECTDSYPNSCECMFLFVGDGCQIYSIWAVLLVSGIVACLIVTAIVLIYCVGTRCPPKCCAKKSSDTIGPYSVMPFEDSQMADESAS